MMQIATVSGNQPWICTVYYAEDENQNLYWLSLPTRRHSQEIEHHNKVAIAIPIKHDKNPIIGIQAEGDASVVKEAEQIAKVMEAYTAKYDTGKDFYDNFMAGKNKHLLYRFTPNKISLFDEVNFSDGEKHIWEK